MCNKRSQNVHGPIKSDTNEKKVRWFHNFGFDHETNLLILESVAQTATYAKDREDRESQA